MGEHIKTTGIKPGQITSGEVSLQKGVERICDVLDHEVVPAVHTVCGTQKSHALSIEDLKTTNMEHGEDIATLKERSAWTKAFIIMGVGSMVTTIFTLIVAVIIPALNGG